MKENIDRSLLSEGGKLLSELIDYSRDAVVSKTLIDKQSGTVTLFSFDKDQGLSEHKAPFDALVYIIEGEMLVGIEQEKHHVKGGELILLPANKMHSLRALNRSKMFLVMIKETAS